MHYQLSSKGEASYQNLTQSTKMPSEEKREKGAKEGRRGREWEKVFSYFLFRADALSSPTV